MLPVTNVNANNKLSWLVKINKNKQAKAVAQQIKRKSTKEIPSAADLAKKLNVSANMLQSPHTRKLALIGKEISSTNQFSKKFLNESKMPSELIRQYSKYGKKYLNVVQKNAKLMKENSKKSISNTLKKIKTKYAGLNKVINNFEKGRYDNDVIVRSIRRGGKSAYNVFSWASKNPNKTLAAAAVAWYWNDPEGFTVALKSSGKTIGEFLSTVAVEASAGIGKGLIDGFKSSMENNTTSSTIFGFILLMTLLLVWKSKTIRRVFSFPFVIIEKKLKNQINNLESEYNLNTEEQADKKITSSRRKKPNRGSNSNL